MLMEYCTEIYLIKILLFHVSVLVVIVLCYSASGGEGKYQIITRSLTHSSSEFVRLVNGLRLLGG